MLSDFAEELRSHMDAGRPSCSFSVLCVPGESLHFRSWQMPHLVLKVDTLLEIECLLMHWIQVTDCMSRERRGVFMIMITCERKVKHIPNVFNFNSCRFCKNVQILGFSGGVCCRQIGLIPVFGDIDRENATYLER